jgi:hypothetical protein
MHQGLRRKGRNRTTHTLSRLARAVTRSLPRVKGALPSSSGSSARLERLEDRRLLATDLVINELVADNASGYKDSVYYPAESPDWIEIYNPTEAAVPLSGWKLKDSSATWTFPNVSIASKGYLVVFADSHNIIDPSRPLHTSFGLSKDGEYLALLHPDNSIADEYNPYPQQNTDISYGRITEAITQPLVTPASTMHGLVPADDLLGNSWQLDTFDDTAWPSGTKGVGYETDSQPTPAPAPAASTRSPRPPTSSTAIPRAIPW